MSRGGGNCFIISRWEICGRMESLALASATFVNSCRVQAQVEFKFLNQLQHNFLSFSTWYFCHAEGGGRFQAQVSLMER